MFTKIYLSEVFGGKVVVKSFSKDEYIETKKSIKIIETGRIYYKREFNKITDHNCFCINQKVVYTLDDSKIETFKVDLKGYYISLWENQILEASENIRKIREEGK